MSETTRGTLVPTRSCDGFNHTLRKQRRNLPEQSDILMFFTPFPSWLIGVVNEMLLKSEELKRVSWAESSFSGALLIGIVGGVNIGAENQGPKAATSAAVP